MGRQSDRPTRPPLPLLRNETVIQEQPDQRGITERYTDEALQFIRKNQDGPFFLYLAHMYVHLPIYVEERFEKDSRNGRYGAAVATIDWATEVIVGELDRLGLAEDTIVIFTSDNGALAPGIDGAGSNAPLRDAKGTTWEGGQRVPCIMRWPGRIEAGLEVHEMATAMDLLPTLAPWCGASAPVDRVIDGEDISGLVVGGGQVPDPERPFLYVKGGDIEAVRSGRWKLHVHKRGRAIAELYDLRADVGETTELAASHPEVVDALTSMVEAGRADIGDEATGTIGSGTRAIGRVAEPVPLASVDPTDPATMAEYDLPHRG
jgi:arylsulfatase A-like enzyme